MDLCILGPSYVHIVNNILRNPHRTKMAYPLTETHFKVLCIQTKQKKKGHTEIVNSLVCIFSSVFSFEMHITFGGV